MKNYMSLRCGQEMMGREPLSGAKPERDVSYDQVSRKTREGQVNE